MRVLDYLIIGGGPHGCALARYLSVKTIYTHLIVDQNPKPLHEWMSRAENCHMHFLRSSAIYHLDTEPDSLLKFAQGQECFEGGIRPSVDLFNRHSLEVIKDLNFRAGWVTDIKRSGCDFLCTLGYGGPPSTIRAKNVVLAIGSPLPNRAYGVPHVFDHHFVEPNFPVMIIGGGISAAHLVLHYVEKYPGKVYWVHRSPITESAWDSHPRWTSESEIRQFQSLPLVERSKIIENERRDGSLPQHLLTNLEAPLKAGHYSPIVASLIEIYENHWGTFDVMLDGHQFLPEVNVIQATGFRPNWHRHWLLDTLSEKLCLPRDDQGRPVLSRRLEWAANLFVIGQLAEMQLGPAARNLVGARLARWAMFDTAL